ncbi:unnamed protein product, partial [Cylicostephanus goldi]
MVCFAKNKNVVEIPESKPLIAALHQKLLDEDDLYLLSLLSPLADSEDDLSDEETQKLPLRLQYYEGKREKSLEVRQKLIEALYQ